jgi:hypothetical protein
VEASDLGPLEIRQTPTVNHVRARQGIRQRAGQAGGVGEHPGDHAAGVGDDVVAADLNIQTA